MTGIDPAQLRQYVIVPTLDKLPGGLGGLAAEELLLGTSLQETGCGRYLHQLGNGPGLSPWSIEPRTHDDIRDNFLKFHPSLAAAVMYLGCGDVLSSTYLAGNLYYACAIARIDYLRAPAPLPKAGDIAGQAAFYKQHFNSGKGKATVDEYLANWRAVFPSTLPSTLERITMNPSAITATAGGLAAAIVVILNFWFVGFGFHAMDANVASAYLVVLTASIGYVFHTRSALPLPLPLVASIAPAPAAAPVAAVVGAVAPMIALAIIGLSLFGIAPAHAATLHQGSVSPGIAVAVLFAGIVGSVITIWFLTFGRGRAASISFAVTAVALLGAVLGGCTVSQITASAQAVQLACNTADTAASQAQSQLKGGALTTANTYATYEKSVCGSADTIAAAAADPSTAQWLSNITLQLNALVNGTPAPAAAPTPAPTPVSTPSTSTST